MTKRHTFLFGIMFELIWVLKLFYNLKKNDYVF